MRVHHEEVGKNHQRKRKVFLRPEAIIMSVAVTDFFSSSRWEQTEASAVQTQLGLDLARKGILPCG